MTGPILLPIRIRRSRKCDRCGLRYLRSQTRCSHCTGLSDREVAALRERKQEERLGNTKLGNLFYLVAALLALVLILSLV